MCKNVTRFKDKSERREGKLKYGRGHEEGWEKVKMSKRDADRLGSIGE